MPFTDVLVVGSGIAGLTLAVKLSSRFPHMKVTILAKSDSDECNTRYAQGGIAIVSNDLNDSFQQHINDTLRAGDGLCDPEIAQIVVCEGPDRLNELIQWGVDFDRDHKGKLLLGCEGGHTANRIVHYKDITGYQVYRSLLHYLTNIHNVELLEHYAAVDLITDSGKKICYGAYVLNPATGNIENFTAKITVLATGGVGQAYRITTNPRVATGDGIAMAHRAGALIRDMEFIQFHPTALYSETDNPVFLISEAMRGFGAHLRNKNGDRFMFRYDERGELASRDIVSKAIYEELLIQGKGSVYLDCRHLPSKDLIEHFPTIYNKCLLKGLDITTQLVPLAPAAHYLCGGIAINRDARTSIENLYACGECSFTGLHGANRLASNSLLEALVFAHRGFLGIERILEQIRVPNDIRNYDFSDCIISPEDGWWVVEARDKLRTIMNEHAGIIRTQKGLTQALQEADALFEKVEILYTHTAPALSLIELRNLITVARLILTHSLTRKENKGTYFNTDLSHTNELHKGNKRIYF